MLIFHCHARRIHAVMAVLATKKWAAQLVNVGLVSSEENAKVRLKTSCMRYWITVLRFIFYRFVDFQLPFTCRLRVRRILVRTGELARANQEALTAFARKALLESFAKVVDSTFLIYDRSLICVVKICSSILLEYECGDLKFLHFGCVQLVWPIKICLWLSIYSTVSLRRNGICRRMVVKTYKTACKQQGPHRIQLC